jgi:hypothetical protein
MEPPRPHRKRSRLAILAVLGFCIATCPAGAQETAAEKSAPVLTETDADGLRALFGAMGKTFVDGSADECLELFAPFAAERNQLDRNIRNEFDQTAYTRFDIVEVRTQEADALRENVYMVDVVMHIECRPRRPILGTNSNPSSYNTNFAFVVHRLDEGFRLRNSDFFRTLGLRGNTSMLLKGATLFVLFIALLVFSVWMGLEAWRERPRQRFWRVAVIVPILGPSAYLLFRLLPRWMNARPARA